MPKFSQAFLEQAASPGLFGAGIVQLGQDLKEANKLRQRQGMLQQLIAGTPEQRAQIMQEEAIRTGNVDMAMQGINMSIAAQQAAGNRIIQPLLTELSNPETSDERAKEIRAEIFDAARANPQLDEGNVRKAFNATNTARIKTNYETLLTQTQELSMLAKRALSAGTDRDTFVAQYGEENGYIFDNERDALETNQLALEKARGNKAQSTFAYTDKELSETMGLTDIQIKRIKAIKGGENKNKAVLSAVIANMSDATLNASLMNYMAEARLVDVAERESLDLDDEEERRVAESLAKKEVLTLFRTGGIDAVAGGEAQAQDQEQEQEPVDYGKIIEELAKKL